MKHSILNEYKRPKLNREQDLQNFVKQVCNGDVSTCVFTYDDLYGVTGWSRGTVVSFLRDYAEKTGDWQETARGRKRPIYKFTEKAIQEFNLNITDFENIEENIENENEEYMETFIDSVYDELFNDETEEDSDFMDKSETFENIDIDEEEDKFTEIVRKEAEDFDALVEEIYEELEKEREDAFDDLMQEDPYDELDFSNPDKINLNDGYWDEDDSNF